MSKWNVGDKVRFSWYERQILTGTILQVKERRFRPPKYRVAYVIGAFGHKTSDSNDWADEKDIFPFDILSAPTNDTESMGGENDEKA